MTTVVFCLCKLEVVGCRGFFHTCDFFIVLQKGKIAAADEVIYLGDRNLCFSVGVLLKCSVSVLFYLGPSVKGQRKICEQEIYFILAKLGAGAVKVFRVSNHAILLH